MTAQEEPNQEDRGRRRFLNWFLGSSAAAFAASIFYPIARFLSTPEIPEATTSQVEAGPPNDPDFVNKGFKIVRFGPDPVIVVRTGEGEFRAFSATCTHLDCIVEFRKDHKDIWCNCHNGKYDLQGRVVSGPPPRPLTKFAVHIAGKSGTQAGTVVISRS